MSGTTTRPPRPRPAPPSPSLVACPTHDRNPFRIILVADRVDEASSNPTSAEDSDMTILQTEPSARAGELPPPATVVSALTEMLSRLGARHAFGVSGGAMAAFWDALSASALGVHHFRHESGATFAAIEASFASRRPVVVFTTTGP